MMELVLFAAVILGIGLVIAFLGLWVWVLIDCATHEPPQGNDKIVWILIILFGGWIGALIYLLARRPRRIEQFGE